MRYKCAILYYVLHYLLLVLRLVLEKDAVPTHLFSAWLKGVRNGRGRGQSEVFLVTRSFASDGKIVTTQAKINFNQGLASNAPSNGAKKVLSLFFGQNSGKKQLFPFLPLRQGS